MCRLSIWTRPQMPSLGDELDILLTLLSGACKSISRPQAKGSTAFRIRCSTFTSSGLLKKDSLRWRISSPLSGLLERWESREVHGHRQPTHWRWMDATIIHNPALARGRSHIHEEPGGSRGSQSSKQQLCLKVGGITLLHGLGYRSGAESQPAQRALTETLAFMVGQPRFAPALPPARRGDTVKAITQVLPCLYQQFCTLSGTWKAFPKQGVWLARRRRRSSLHFHDQSSRHFFSHC